jgi:hypothetical protein
VTEQLPHDPEDWFRTAANVELRVDGVVVGWYQWSATNKAWRGATPDGTIVTGATRADVETQLREHKP